MKRTSASLVIREMQIKTTITMATYPLGWLEFKRLQKPSANQDMEQMERTFITGGNEE